MFSCLIDRPRVLLALLLLLITCGTVAAQDADSLEGKQIKIIQEIVIDDSGIRINEGDEQLRVQVSGTDEERVKIRITSSAADSFCATSINAEDDDGLFKFNEDYEVGAGECYAGDMLILFGDMDVRGKIVGDVVVIGGSLRIHDSAEISGDAVCIGRVLECAPGARIAGDLEHLGGPGTWDCFGSCDDGGVSWLKITMVLVEMMLSSMLGTLLLGRRAKAMAETLAVRPMRSLLIGFLGMFLALLLAVPFIILLILMMVTVIGIPIAILLTLALFVFLTVCWLVPLFFLSRLWLQSRGMNRYLAVAIMTLAFWVFHILGHELLPFPLTILFLIVEWLAFTFGLGSMLISRLGHRLPPAPAPPSSGE